MVMVCQMQLDQSGSVQAFEFHEGVIHSHARLTYTEVAQTLEKKRNGKTGYLPHLYEFHRLFKTLLKQRQIRGAIDFETTETRIIFADNGKIDRIVPTERNVAHRMIEEAMLLANVCAAKMISESELPGLYRNHKGPDEQKLMGLRDFLKAFGLRLSGGDDPAAMDYAKLLQRIQKREDCHLLQTVMLRSLRQALYSPENDGHFGLAFTEYTHFTSPIRRYPDVIVHRILKHMIASKQKTNAYPYDHEAITELGAHCSMTERRADMATRDAVTWLKCDFMLDKVGQEFSGIVSAVTSFGIFVELNDIYIEGLVHISALANDYYHFDDVHHRLTGKRSGKVYRLGDAIRVTVARVDLDDRKIDFEVS